MRNLLLTLCYDGTNYHGFQRQPVLPTIQGVVEGALTKVFKTPISITGCSRTDAGVHARQYLCNFHCQGSIPAEKVPLALRALLPADICAFSCREVPDWFQARRCVKRKTYCYTINTAPCQDVFRQRFEWHFHRNLDLDAMRQAAQVLLGTHDFSAFMAAGGDAPTTVRTVEKMELVADGSRISMYITAQAYLYNMVRIIMGTLVSVGLHKMTPVQVAAALQSGKRADAGMTAPPQGLILYEVELS